MQEKGKVSSEESSNSIYLQTPLSLIVSYLMKCHVKSSLSVQMLLRVIVYVGKCLMS